MATLRSVFVYWLSWLGVLVGIFSGVSALVRILNIGISGFLADLFFAYRALMTPIYDLFEFFLPSVPQLAVDTMSLYLVLLGMSLRAAVLPLRNPDYLQLQIGRDAKTWTEFRHEPRDGRSLIEQFTLDPDSGVSIVFASESPGQPVEILWAKNHSVAYSWAKWIALSIALWPALTLLPARRINRKLAGLKDAQVDEKSSVLRIENDNGLSMVMPEYAHYIRTNRENLIQMLVLPFAIVLFLLLAAYNPF